MNRTRTPAWSASFALVAAILACPALPASADVAVEILSPVSGNVTSSQTVLVSGNVTPGASVAVDGVLVHVMADGNWSVRVALAVGANTIRVEAWDGLGNQSNDSVEVQLIDPAAELEADLTDVLDELRATQEDLNRTQNELAEAQSDLADVMAELAETRDDLGATQANLTETQQDLTDSRARLTEVSAASGFSGPAGTALIVGLAGLVLGAAGVAMALLMGRKRHEDSGDD